MLDSIIEIEYKFNNSPRNQGATAGMSAAAANASGARLSKGEVARARLKEAAVTVLDRVGYHQMRVKDVTGEAGVAAGLFHHYYRDLRSLVDEIIEEHIARFEATEEIERGVSKGDWLSRLRSHYEVVVASYAEHPGIMRCIAQFCADDPDFRERWKRSYNHRLQQLFELFPHMFPASELDPGEARLVVYALGGVGQDVLNETYIERNPRFLALGLSEAEMAEWLAVLFYRGLFAANPPRQQLRHAGKILSIRR
jgi:AcrR family transcriptional regulator